MQIQHTHKANNYHSYLLRLWRAETDEGGNWRASLETVGSGEKRGFAQLEKLFLFLEQAHQDAAAPPNAQDTPSNSE